MVVEVGTSKQRHNSSWTDTEERLLRKRVRAGMSKEEMAKAHDRTPGAIGQHLSEMDLSPEYSQIQSWLDEKISDEEFFSFMLKSENFSVTDFSDRNAMEALLSDKNSSVPDWVYYVLVANTIVTVVVGLLVILVLVSS
jgi:hypothetical protein